MADYKRNIPLDFEFGKIPPQAVEFEEVVLGAIMIEKDSLLEVIDILKPESFYKEEHQKIYQAIIDLFQKDKCIDMLTVVEQLKVRMELDLVGGPVYISGLTSKVSTSAHILDHSQIISQKYIQRELIRISTEIQNKAFDDSIDVSDLLEFADEELTSITINKPNEIKKLSESITEVVHELEEISKREETLSGIKSGLIKLDRITNGWQNSDLIILAARPSMGKTALALKFGKESAMSGKKTLIVSLEMSHKQLTKRYMGGRLEVEPRILNGKLPDYMWEQIDHKIGKLLDLPLYIYDKGGISLFELKSVVRRMSRKFGIELIILDYLQLMISKDKNQNREQEISNISRGLKEIAKNLDIPIIALSQLNRKVEERGGFKRPLLSDLRESGAIEQDADLVLFLHRPKKYGITEFDDEDQTPVDFYYEGKDYEVSELNIAKHRNGAIASLKLIHNEEMTYIDDYFKPVNNDIVYKDFTEKGTDKPDF